MTPSNGLAGVLSDDEVLALGLSSIVNNGIADQDNQFVEALSSGGELPQVDRDGRNIISYRQFQEISGNGGRLDNYSMRVIRPGARGVWNIQASKYLKWFGLGYVALGAEEEKARAKPERRAPKPAAESTPDITIYMCKDKYPDCPRFFDTQKGLQFHWKKEHGEAPIRRPRTTTPQE